MLALRPKKISPELRREFAKIYINKCITPKNKKQEKLEKYTKVAVLMHNAKTLIFSVGKLAPQCVKKRFKKIITRRYSIYRELGENICPDFRRCHKSHQRIHKMKQYGEYNVKKKMKKLTER